MRIAQPPAMERQLRIALDNMPGALVYTDDDLNILFCNDRFREMYPVPGELLQSGRPYPAFLHYLAEHGYYGEGDIDAQVPGASKVCAIRGAYFEIAPPTAVVRILPAGPAADGHV